MKEGIETSFEEFWSAKPKRSGGNPKKNAREKFMRLVASGIDPQKIIGAARAWARDEIARGKSGTEYVAMAVTWLNQERFDDYAPPPKSDRQAQIEFMRSKGYEWQGQDDDVGSWVRIQNYAVG